MAINEHKPVRPETIASDREALVMLKKLADYAPVNSAFSIEALEALDAQLREAEQALIVAEKALAAARAARIAAEWELHNAMLGAKTVVVAQYGANSEAVQSIGLKKKALYRRPSRRRIDAA